MADIVLGFDFGLARIGVAVGQRITQTASPIGIIKAKDGIPCWQELDTLIEKWQATHLIVGIPYCMNNSESELTVAAKRFQRRLQGRFDLPVIAVDEKLSSAEVQSYLQDQEKKYRHIDAFAAVLILEQWLSD